MPPTWIGDVGPEPGTRRHLMPLYEGDASPGEFLFECWKREFEMILQRVRNYWPKEWNLPPWKCHINPMMMSPSTVLSSFIPLEHVETKRHHVARIDRSRDGLGG